MDGASRIDLALPLARPSARWDAAAARGMSGSRVAGLPLQPAGRRSGGDQLRRRQHLGQAGRARSDHRRADPGAVGEGLRRRPGLDRRRRLRPASTGVAAGAGGAFRRSGRRGPDGRTLYAYAAFEPGTRAPSIDTPMHALLPSAHIDHVHPDAVIALAAATGGGGRRRVRSGATWLAGRRGCGPASSWRCGCGRWSRTSRTCAG